MKQYRAILIFLLLLSVLTTTALAADGLQAERTSYGMEVDGISALADLQFCAVYDEHGKMLAVQLIEDPTEEILIYCDVNEVRRVSVFAMAENSFVPVGTASDVTLDAPETPIHVHTWDKGRVTAEPGCETEGVITYTCTSNSCNESPKATWTAPIAPVGHSWGKWRPQDVLKHYRSCEVDPSHRQIRAHNWQEGRVIVAPTVEHGGEIEYFCPDCRISKIEYVPALEPKDVWFTYDRDNEKYVIHWKEDTLESNERYFVNFLDDFYVGTDNSYMLWYLEDNLLDLSSMDIIIEKGDYHSSPEERTVLYRLENAIQVETLESANFTLTGQTDGTYRIGTDWDITGMTVCARLKNNDGIEVVEACYDTTDLNIYPWDGSTMDLMAATVSISDDTGSLIVRRTPTESVKTFVRPAAPAARTVTTAEELETALTVGGAVTMGADISADYMDIYGGEPVVLDLNGHTLDIPNLAFLYGKEMTIVGTDSGSAVNGEIRAGAARCLTIDGGSYGEITIDWIHSVSLRNAQISADNTALGVYDFDDLTLTNCQVTSEEQNALAVWYGDSLTVTGGTFKSLAPAGTSNMDMRYEAIEVNEVEVVTLTDVTASSVSGSAADLQEGSCAVVRGGSYRSESVDMAAAAVGICDFDSADVGGKQDGTSDPDDLVLYSRCSGLHTKDVPQVTVSDLTSEAHTDTDCTSSCNRGFCAVWITFPVGTSGQSASLTRVTGVGNHCDALLVTGLDTLTIDNCDFSLNGLNGAKSAMHIAGIGAVTIRDTTGENGYFGLYLSDCGSAELSNLTLSCKTFDASYVPASLSARGISVFKATNSTISGHAWFYDYGNYVLSGCIISGDVEANGDSGYVAVNLTDSLCLGKKTENERGSIIPK